MDTKVERLHSRAVSLVAEFQKGGKTTARYIHEAIVLDREALELCPLGHHNRSASLTRLGGHLFTRYEALGATKDLDEAIVLNREVLQLRLQGHPYHLVSLGTLAVCLGARYNRLGVMQDLDEALILHRNVLQLCPQGHPYRSLSLNNLAAYLSTRYKKLGAMRDLDEAIVLNREALRLRPQGHPNRLSSLINLAAIIYVRFGRFGDTKDLNDSIALNREALQLCPKSHSGRSASLSNLAAVLNTRYEKLGAMQDLDEAIVLEREALELRPYGHPDRSLSLNNLALDLAIRYNKLGTIQDLDEAIVFDREGLQLRPQGHPNRSMSLSSLASHLSTRYNKLGVMQNLNEAIDLDQEALRLRLQGHPDRSMSLNNLANHLGIRYCKFGAMQDLDNAITLDRQALQLRPHGHPDRPSSLHNLAIHLDVRYERLEATQDLDEAIVLHQEALQLHPRGHPDRSMSLSCLAEHLRTRYKLGALQKLDTSYPKSSNQSSDLDTLFGIYAQLADLPHMVSSNDLSASRTWIRDAEHFQHSSIVLAYDTSLRLLTQHMSILPSLPQHLNIFREHTSSLAVDAFSACLRNHAPQRAVELLEQGRGVFWGQLARLRSPLDVVAFGPAGKSLADEFKGLASLIREVFCSPAANQHEQLCHLNLKMYSVVTAIRELPGLSRFLLPSLFSDLQCAASGGPVIIVNASKYGCDALVVFSDRDPAHVPLSVTKRHIQLLSSRLRASTARSKSMNIFRVLGEILRELWNDVVSPIVNFLRTTHPLRSRIWWCPTGDFSDLPLHAAGPYKKGQQNLPDLYISSYTPTLSALIHARRPGSSASESNVQRFVAIGQADASGQNKLPSVHSELDIVGQCVQGLTTFTQIEGDESCISRVIEELGQNEWVHFACHGLPNRREPFESAFTLHDGPFTIERIAGCDLQNSEFAYLSACHTTVGDGESPDEVIHLAAAMQFAGFRSVVGTMWAVDDAHTNKITSMFYRYMVDDESGRLDPARAAFALNNAVRSVGVPLDQRALYIHIGA